MNEPLREAARYYAADDCRTVETVCRSTIRREPNHFDALHLLAVALTTQERREETLRYLRRAEVCQPDHAPLLVNLGNVLLAMKQFKEAVAVSR